MLHSACRDHPFTIVHGFSFLNSVSYFWVLLTRHFVFPFFFNDLFSTVYYLRLILVILSLFYVNFIYLGSPCVFALCVLFCVYGFRCPCAFVPFSVPVFPSLCVQVSPSVYLPRPSHFPECSVLPLPLSYYDVLSPFVSCRSPVLPLMLPHVPSLSLICLFLHFCVMFHRFLFYCESLVFSCLVYFPCGVLLIYVSCVSRVFSLPLLSFCVALRL